LEFWCEGRCWGGLVEKDSNPSLVSSTSALIGSDPDEVVVQGEATTENGQMVATSRTNQRGDASKAGLQVLVAVLWKMEVVAMKKKIRNRLW
jgi:hypothetical protein